MLLLINFVKEESRAVSFNELSTLLSSIVFSFSEKDLLFTLFSPFIWRKKNQEEAFLMTLTLFSSGTNP